MSNETKPTENAPPSALDAANLAFGIIAILLLAGSLMMGYVPQIASKLPASLPDYTRYAGLAFMGLYAVTFLMLNEKQVAAFLKHRHTHSGLNILIQVAGVIGILAAINYWGVRHHSRIDLTENKQYSLSEQSKKVAQGLKEPVSVKLFVKKGNPQAANIENLWREYTYASDKVKLEVIDLDREPTAARQFEITSVNSSLLTRGERKTTISGTQEQDLTSALIKVSQDGQKTIYFTIGHGELAYDKFDGQGLSQLKDALEKQNYKIDQLALFNKGEVPSDAAVVIVPGPSKPFAQKELDALSTYIDKGGRVLLTLQTQAKTNVESLTSKYGIEIKNDLVLDPKANLFNDLATPVVQKFPYHTVTTNLQAAYFPASRSLAKAKQQPKDVTNIAPLVETTADAWGETDLKSRPVRYNEGADTKGPIPLMLLAEKANKARFIVSGNSMFITNENYQQISNGDLFMNALNWMADEDSLVSIPPKEPSNRSVNLVPAQYYALFYGTVLGFPLVLLLCGAVVWWRRR